MHSRHETNAGNIWSEIDAIENQLRYIAELAHEHGEIPDAAGHMDACVTALADAKQAIADWSAAGFKALGEEIERMGG